MRFERTVGDAVQTQGKMAETEAARRRMAGIAEGTVGNAVQRQDEIEETKENLTPMTIQSPADSSGGYQSKPCPSQSPVLGLHGDYFDGVSSRKYSAQLVEIAGEKALLLKTEDKKQNYPKSALKLSQPLEGVAPFIIFPDGGKLYFKDEPWVQHWLGNTLEKHLLKRFRYWLESHIGIVVAALVLVGICSIGFVKIVIPYLSEKIAERFTAPMLESLDHSTLSMVDGLILKESELSKKDQDHVQKVFETLVASSTQGPYRFRLVFRKGQNIGPNAFALPYGTVVITDELVDLAKHDEELTAVFSHEIGHVLKRHGVKQVLSQSGVALMLSLFTSNSSSAMNLASSLSTMLIESGYSRQFEREADLFALKQLKRLHISTHHWKNILLSLAKAHQQLEEEKESTTTPFSSHPSIKERLELIEEVEHTP